MYFWDTFKRQLPTMELIEAQPSTELDRMVLKERFVMATLFQYGIFVATFRVPIGQSGVVCFPIHPRPVWWAVSKHDCEATLTVVTPSQWRLTHQRPHTWVDPYRGRRMVPTSFGTVHSIAPKVQADASPLESEDTLDSLYTLVGLRPLSTLRTLPSINSEELV